MGYKYVTCQNANDNIQYHKNIIFSTFECAFEIESENYMHKGGYSEEINQNHAITWTLNDGSLLSKFYKAL